MIQSLRSNMSVRRQAASTASGGLCWATVPSDPANAYEDARNAAPAPAAPTRLLLVQGHPIQSHSLAFRFVYSK